VFGARTTKGSTIHISRLSPDKSSITRIGLALAKAVFQVHAVDAAGAELDKRAIRRGKPIAYCAA